MKDILYIKFDQNMAVYTADVMLGDVAEMECANQAIVNRLRTIKLFSFQNARKGAHTCAARRICSLIEVVGKIHEVYPNLEIENLGETDFIVEYSTKKGENLWILTIKVVLIVAITFCGSAFSIMTFHSDVSVPSLFAQLYELFTGQVSDGFTILELTYSLGLTLGIVAFFNHPGRRRLTRDPTPIEVEMRLYENDIDTTLIRTAQRNGVHKRDSGGTQ